MLPPDGNDGATRLPTARDTGVSGADDMTPAPAARGAVPRTRASGPLSVGAAFGTRYRILKLLGVGGMGAVYHAWDEELGLAVALKVIRPDVIADPAATADMEHRFKRELVLARRVTHRNVVRIHDLGEIDGIKYITMPYVQGEDLATRLQRDGKLPVRTALPIVRHVVAGLAAAHEGGVVHRDLKPANIMIDAENHALIMDFGIARSAASSVAPPSEVKGLTIGSPGGTAFDSDPAASISPDAAVTVAPPPRVGTRMTPAGIAASIAQGAIVGTLEYMAPEQARGEPADQRADIYACGLIWREMLLGLMRRPEGMSRVEALHQRIEEQPVSLRLSNPDIPDAVDAVITRCLQLNPADRFQTTAELDAALGRLDDDGQLIPEPFVRRFMPQLIAAAVLLVAVLVTGTWWLSRRAVPVEHAALSVLIADFENATKDPTLDRTVEQSLGIALEEASFINAFARETAVKLAQQMRSTSRIDEATARLIAVRENVNVVIAGKIEPRGSGYRIGVRAVDATLGKDMQEVSGEASDKNAVLRTVSQLASKLRDGFGDTTPASVRQAQVETFTSSSLEAMREYVIGGDLASAGRQEEAIAHYRAALAKDQQFGRAYSGWASSAHNLGRSDEANDAYKKAFAVLDRMTEREKLRTLGSYYLHTGSYEKAVDSYSELVKTYPADRAGHSNLAFAYFGLLNFPKAMEEGRQAVQLYPRGLTFRSNYALYAMYASDFKTAAAEAATVLKDDPGFSKGYLPIAMSAVDSGELAAARAAYDTVGKSGAVGASRAAGGLGDLALYAGLYDEAVMRLRAGIAADEKSRLTGGIVAKYMALGEALLEQGRSADAQKAVKAGLARSTGLEARIPAARVLLGAGAGADTRKIVDELAGQLQPQQRAYAKILEGEIALARKRPAEAVEALLAARKLTDLWLGRFDLGIAYVQAGAPAEAVSELETAQKRRGEATALFLDDWPTVHYLATLPYWLGRAQEGIGTIPGARQNYAAFLKIRAAAPKDPLAADARKRLAALPQ